MIDALPLLLGPEGYQISRSVRLRSSASAYLNRTNSSSVTNNKIFTYSLWVKRGSLGVTSSLLAGDNSTAIHYFGYGNSSAAADTLEFYDGQTAAWKIQTNAVYRDPSAYYHVILSVDTTQATAANRVRIYVNGVECSYATATYPAQNTVPNINVASMPLYIGRRSNASQWYFDGYLTEINFIDGQALTPSSFGETNAVTGVWQPKKYAGTYGTNGFYLNFSDNSAVTTSSNVGIGKDFSGNGNYWTSNSISVSAGVTYDSMLDVPTPYADGDNGRGNYCTLNPLDRSTSTNAPVPTNGNLAYATASVAVTWAGVKGTISFSTGKYYFEDDISSLGVNSIGFAGWTDSDTIAGDMSNYFSKMGGLLIRNDSAGIGEAKMVFGTTTSFASGADATNGLFQLAIDFDAGKFWIGKNNTWFGSGDPAAGTNEAGTFTANRQMTPLLIAHYATTNGNITHAANFGQRPFSYTPPTGFKALNTQNLPTPTISNGANYMAATTYTGTGASQNISNAVNGISMQPDLVWIKRRNAAYDHDLFDAVRGAGLSLYSSTTAAEGSGEGQDSFNTNGFTVSGNHNRVNISGGTFAAWQWNAGGSTVTNTSGSISAQVRANPTAGFSVVTYTGTGANATVGHGLGVAPKMIIVKNRSSVSSWIIAFDSSGFTWSSDYYQFDTSAKLTNASGTMFRQAPTSSVFSVGTNSNINGSTNTLVAYCFSAIAGYSAFGSYTGNGSADGPFVYLGFRPRYLLIKSSVVAGGTWVVFDSARSTYNVTGEKLAPNTADSENSGATGIAGGVDFLSNGFKIRLSWGDINTSNTLIYAAFAEVPFKSALGR